MIEVNQDVLQQINKSFVIPPHPELLADLKALSEQEEPLLADVADVIAKDVAISAAILKTINSPAFGLARTVSDIRQAVMFLGLEGAFSLVQGLKLKEAFDPTKSCISLNKFWENSALILDRKPGETQLPNTWEMVIRTILKTCSSTSTTIPGRRMPLFGRSIRMPSPFMLSDPSVPL